MQALPFLCLVKLLVESKRQQKAAKGKTDLTAIELFDISISTKSYMDLPITLILSTTVLTLRCSRRDSYPFTVTCGAFN